MNRKLPLRTKLPALLFVFFCIASPVLFAQTTIVNYNFNSGTSYATMVPVVASGITSSVSGTDAYATSTGIATNAAAFTANTAGRDLTMTNSSGTNSRYWTFNVSGSSLRNYSTFKIYFQSRRVSTGAKTITIQYSLNGGTYTATGISPLTVAPGNGSFTAATITLPAAVNNPLTSLGIRLLASGASGTGKLRIDNFEVQGSLSKNSDVITNTGYVYTQNVAYNNYQSASGLTTANSVGVQGLTIRDGGASGDGDAVPTTLTNISFSTGGATVIRRAAIFDGTTNIAEVNVAGATSFSFSGLTLAAADNSTKNLELRVTYQSLVTDNQQVQFTVTSATAAGTGSGFASANAGAAISSVSGNNNKLAVTATRLTFTTQPTSTNPGSIISPAIIVIATDPLNNIDLDYTAPVVMTTTGTFSVSATTSVIPVSGVATFNNLSFSATGTGISINGTSGSLTATGNSSAFNITGFTTTASDYFRSQASGNWSTASTWQGSHNNVDWFTATSAPTSTAASVKIQSAHSITVITAVSCNNLTVDGTLVNSGTITQSGSTIFSSTGTYQHNFTTTSGIIPAATWAAGSKCLVTGYTSFTGTPTGGAGNNGGYGQAFSNFTWNCPNQSITSAINLGGVLTTVSNNLTITATGSGSLNLGSTSTGNLAVGGDFSQSAGNFILSSGAARTMTVNGNFSLTGGTFNLSSSTTAANAAIINVTGNFTHTGGTLTESGSTTGSGIVFTAGTHLYTSGGTVSNIVNYTVNNGSTLQMGTGANPAIISSGSTGAFNLLSGATLGVTSPEGITTSGATGNIQLTGTRTFAAGASYLYNGTSAQVTGNGLTQNTALHFTIDNPTSVTLSAATAISGDLTISQGLLNTSAGNFNLTLGGNWTNEGDFTAGTSTETFTGTNKIITGGSGTDFGNLVLATGANYTLNVDATALSLVFNSSAAASSLTHAEEVSLDIAGDVTVNQPSANSVTTSWNINDGASSVSGAINFAGTNTTSSRVGKIVILSGILDINKGISFAGTTAATKVIDMSGGAGALNLSGPLTAASSATLNAGTSGSRFNYEDDSLAQTVNFFGAGAYHNLRLNNTGGTGAALSAAITAANVTGDLSVESGTFNNGGFAITGNSVSTFSVSDSATCRLSGISSGFPSGFGAVVLDTASTVDYAGSGAQTIAAQNYGNLTTTLNGTRTISLAGSGIIGIAGTFVPANATTSYIVTGSTVSFNGSSTQSIPPFTFNNLVNNNAGSTLSGNVTITGSTNALSFLSGIISTGANTLTLGSATTISGAGASQYVNGRLAWGFTNAIGSKTFPIGKGGNYRPLTFSYTAAPGAANTVTAEQVEAALTGTNTPAANALGARYWTISQTGATTPAYKLTLDATGISSSAGSNMVMIKSESGTGISTAVTSPNYTNTTAFTSLTNSGSSFALGENNIPTTTTVSALSAVTYGSNSPVTLTATVSANNPGSGGTVTFKIDGVTVGAGTTNASGIATYSYTPTTLTAGSHTVAAFFTATAFASSNGSSSWSINPKTITASLTGTVTKAYNGTIAATLGSGNYSFNTGDIINGDIVSITNTSGTYDTRHVGTAKAITVTGLVLGGSNAANYTLASGTVTGNVGTITTATLTVTAQTDTKIYNGTNSSSVSPVVTGTLYGTDVVSTVATQIFSNKHVGTGKTLTASGLVINDGNSGNNYSISYINNITGVITARSITVTAQTDTKVYDGTTSSSVAPVTGTLYGTDVVSTVATQLFSSKHVGTGKTLIASGLVINDGNSGNNYSISYINNTTGVITARSITVTAQTDTKVYDGTTSSSIAPVAGTLYGTDAISTAATQTFNNKNAGTGKTLTASGLVINDGNSGNNYNISYINNTSGMITARSVTVTAQADTKIYDGTTNSSVVPVTGTLYGTDAISTAATQAFSSKHVGTGKTLTASGLVINDGNSGNNYSISYINNTTGVITARSITVTAQTATKVYDGTINSSVTPLVGTLYGTDAISTAATQTYNNKNAGTGKTLTAAGLVINDGNGGNNYTVSYISNSTGAITVKNITVTANGGQSKMYGTTDPVFTYSVSPALFAGDAFAGALSRGRGENVGLYAFAKGTLTAGSNYQVSFVANHLTITAAPLYITVNDMEKCYGENILFTGTEFTAEGLYFTDAVNSVSISSSGAPANAAADETPYAINATAASGTGLSNYSITYIPGSLLVNAMPVKYVISGGGSYCDGDIGATISIASSEEGIDYQLIKDNTEYVGSSVSGTGSQLDIEDIIEPGTYTVLATNSSTGCSVFMTGTATVTQGTVPAAPGSITGPANVCPYVGNNQAITYSISSVPAAAYYDWSIPDNMEMVSANGGTSITVKVMADFAAGDITVHSVSACGASDSAASLSLVLNKPVMQQAIRGDRFVCKYVNTNDSVRYCINAIPYATNYRWQVPEGVTILSGQGDTSIWVKFADSLKFGSLFMYVRAFNNCSSSTAAVMVLTNIRPAKPAAIFGETNACPHANGDTLSYYIHPVPGATGYRWNSTGIGMQIISGLADTVIKVKFLPSFTKGSIAVVAIANCGVSAACNQLISRLLPSAPSAISGPTNPCPYAGGDSLAAYSIKTVPNAVAYVWRIPAGAHITGVGSFQLDNPVADSIVTADTLIFVNYDGLTPVGNICISVTALSNCSRSAARAFSLIRKRPATPGAIISSTPKVCAVVGTENPVSYRIRKVANALTYSWQVPHGAVIVGAGANSFAPVQDSLVTTDTIIFVRYVSIPDQGSSIRVCAINLCTESADRVLPVSSSIPGPPAVVNGLTSICSKLATGDTVRYSIGTPAPAAANSYSWSVSDPATMSITDASGPDSVWIAVSYDPLFKTGSVLVRGESGCGTGPARTIRVTASPDKPAAITASAQACATARVAYSIDPVPAASGYIWAVPNGASILDGQGTTAINVQYPADFTAGIVTVKAFNNCMSGNATGLAVNNAGCRPGTHAAARAVAATGISTEIKTTKATVYPNPNQGDFTISIETANKAPFARIQLLGMYGALVWDQKLPVSKDGKLVCRVSAKTVAEGVYEARYTIGDETGSVKVIINR